MDEKNLNESEKMAKDDIFADDDSATDGDVSADKAQISEEVTGKSESIDSESPGNSSEDPLDDERIPAEADSTKTDEKDGNERSADTSLEDNFAPRDETAGEIENETAETDETFENSDEMESVNATHIEDPKTAEGIETEADRGDDDHLLDEAAFIIDTDDPESVEPQDENSGVAEPESAQAQTDGEDVIESETAGTDDGSDDLAQEAAIETPAKKKPALKVAVSALIITAVFSGFLFFDSNSKLETTPEKASKISQNREIGNNAVPRKKTIRPLTPRISSAYNAKIEAVTALRDSLLLKQDEIMRLKKHYRDGIEELEKEIWDESQKRQCKTFFQAMESDSITFTLRTIQRRQAYIQQLERPSKWIHQACEELLYIKRRTLMDLEMAEIVSGIDMNRHVRRIDAAIRKYQPDADKLALETSNPQLEPLESIWERIQEKTQQYASVRVQSKNQIISEQICAGDFERLTELSQISSETARCITEIQTADLFLNSVTEISPGAARQLIDWKGSWICLNGVRALSPRAAHYLFQWDGSWISLNGLTEFPAEIGETLLQWEGRQLELMGLQYIEDFPAKIAFEYLARWERAGGKLFVPKSVRKKINEMHRKSI